MSKAETLVSICVFECVQKNPNLMEEIITTEGFKLEQTSGGHLVKKKNDGIAFDHSVLTLISHYFPSSWKNALLGYTMQTTK